MPGRILVLDDEENYAEMLQDLLLEHDFLVDKATKPEWAINQLEEIPYDLVISDYKMPVMDGADFLKRAREIYPNLPVILVSGLMNTPELVKVSNLGVTHVMEKPLNTDIFLEQVARFAEPMSDAEKSDLATSSDPTEISNPNAFPDEVRFFAASSTVSNQFLKQLWKRSQQSNAVVVLEDKGGDLELAAREISQWKGNRDLPIRKLGLEELYGMGADGLATSLAQEEVSNVCIVRLPMAGDVARFNTFIQDANWNAAASHFLIGVSNSSIVHSRFRSVTNSEGLILPPLAMRPSDLMTYAKRAIRKASDRLQKQCDLSQFSETAVMAILCYSWPGNLTELEELLTKVVKEYGGVAVQESVLIKELGELQGLEVEAKFRLKRLMQSAQLHSLRKGLKECRSNKDLLADELELDYLPETEDEMSRMPLIEPSLGRI